MTTEQKKPQLVPADGTVFTAAPVLFGGKWFYQCLGNGGGFMALIRDHDIRQFVANLPALQAFRLLMTRWVTEPSCLYRIS